MLKELDRIREDYDAYYAEQTEGRWWRHTLLTWVAVALWWYLITIALGPQWPVLKEHIVSVFGG